MEETARPPLHNFSFPTQSWGRQRLLRCQKTTRRSEEEEEEEEGGDLARCLEAARPWNLRLRRAACNAPAKEGAEKREERSEKRRGFSRCLSKEEIEEDFLALAGSKPPRRPRKHPRPVHKQIETIYPGLYLCEITPELYRTCQDK
ncbi:uncharacterized protein LOC144703006 [Wolffia australiana]